MYGLILLTVKDLIVKKFGEKVWKKVCATAQAPEEYQAGQPYDDKLVYDLVAAASKVLNVSQTEVLEIAGYWFVPFVKSTEYGRILSLAGSSFPEALRNVNAMHGHMRVAHFQQMTMPTIRCVFEAERQVRVQYTPGRETRSGLGPFLVGLIKALAEVEYNLHSVAITQENVRGENGCTYDEYILIWDEERDESDESSDRAADQTQVLGLSGRQFAAVFPFHVAFDRQLELVQTGSSMRKLLPAATLGKRFDQLFSVSLMGSSNPLPSGWNFKTARQWVDEPATLRAISPPQPEGSSVPIQLLFRGQFLLLREPVKCLVFVGSPMLRDISQAQKLGLALSDFAIHDPTKDVLFFADARAISELNSAKKPSSSGEKKKDKKEPQSASTVKLGSDAASRGLLDQLFGSRLRPPKSAAGTAFPVAPSAVVASGSAPNSARPSSPPPVRPNGHSPLSNGGHHRAAHLGISPDDSLDDVATTSSSPNMAALAALCPMAGKQQTNGHTALAAVTSGTVAVARPSLSRIGSQFYEILVQDSWNRFSLSQSLLKYSLVNKLPSRDRLVDALVNFYDSRQSALDLINAVLEQEARDALIRNENFMRSHECTPVRLIHSFCELEGGIDFLKKVIGPIHAAMIASPADPNSELLVMRQALTLTTQLLQSVMATLENGTFPLALWRILMSCFQIAVRTNLPRPIEGVSCVLFLRYLHAALISPDSYHMSTHPLSSANQRVAIQIAKLSQAAVNAVVEPSENRQAVPADHQQLVTQILNRIVDLRALNSRAAKENQSSSNNSQGNIPTAVNSIRDFLLENADGLLQSESFGATSENATPIRKAFLALSKLALSDVIARK